MATPPERRDGAEEVSVFREREKTREKKPVRRKRGFFLSFSRPFSSASFSLWGLALAVVGWLTMRAVRL